MPTPTIGTVTTHAESNSVGSFSFSATIDPTANAAVLYVAVSFDASADRLSSLTVAGAACTKLAASEIATGSNRRCYFWYLFNPTTGSQSVDGSLSSNQRSTDIVIPVIGLDTSAEAKAFRGVTAASGAAGTSPSVAVSSASGQLVLDGAMHNYQDLDGIVVGAGQTEFAHVATSGGGGNSIEAACSTAPGAASVTMTWTKSGSNSGWNQSALALAGPGGGLPGRNIHVFNQAAINRASRY